jgi:hypothetical protein
MQKNFNLILFLIFNSYLFSQNVNFDKILYVKNIQVEINIDGLIDPIWSEADSTNDFIQFEPYFNQKPSVETTVKVLADEFNLYFLFICFEDDISKIRANNGMHDGFTGDIVSVMLDSFGDKQSAYKFAVNASGVMSDSRLLDDGRNRDYTWDGIWYADSKIYQWGFAVEIKIPFKSIKFDKNLNQWGIDFDRWRSFNREDSYWCRYEQNEGQRISKFGRLVFLKTAPIQSGLNLEIYPVGINKFVYQNNKYIAEPSAGLDITYNPSEQLTLLFSAYPDFAQIEADPFNFNISRYETYFRERRPFFTQGNEIFMPSGKENNSGFYNPLELFYSRRIGRILPNGKQVPLIFGAKFFGKINDYDYGAFVSGTGRMFYNFSNNEFEEPQAIFGVVRIKRKILENSTIGVLFANKSSKNGSNSVLDIDGAFRDSDWQLSYQIAAALKNSKTDFAFSSGFKKASKTWITLFRLRGIGNNFNVSEIGFVPWRGTFNTAIVTGPNFIFDEGAIGNIFTYSGIQINYEHEDLFYDRGIFAGVDVEMRNGWGLELNIQSGKNRDNEVSYDFYELNLSSRVQVSQNWNAYFWSGYSKTYNFRRNYLSFYSWLGSNISFRPVNYLNFGTSLETFIEGNPKNEIEDITITARPFTSFTPINNLNLRIYVDNVFLKSSEKLERMVIGFLFSWNFSPKSWIYFAVNEFKTQLEDYDKNGNLISRSLKTADRVGVFKIRYLYYF